MRRLAPLPSRLDIGGWPGSSTVIVASLEKGRAEMARVSGEAMINRPRNQSPPSEMIMLGSRPFDVGVGAARPIRSKSSG
jgi:hypothetical protein